jgi:hypothetical protein
VQVDAGSGCNRPQEDNHATCSDLIYLRRFGDAPPPDARPLTLTNLSAGKGTAPSQKRATQSLLVGKLLISGTLDRGSSTQLTPVG